MAATSVSAGSFDSAVSRSLAAPGRLDRAAGAGPFARPRNHAHSTRTRSRMRPASLNTWRTAASLPPYRPSRGESASREERVIGGCGRFKCRITQYYRKRLNQRGYGAMTATTRVERDSMGALDVPASALWGAQTQRAVQNFPATGMRMPRAFIRALGLIKAAAAGANAEAGDLPPDLAAAIQAAALDVAAGRYDDQFPVDVFQTGSGTSSNMNANEVIATLASRLLTRQVHPNDHVNMAQSSNDVVPTAIHVAAALLLSEDLLPALERLRTVLGERAADFGDVVKTGRTHLMDAMPVTLAQELLGWQAQIDSAAARLQSVTPRLYKLAQGGTAVGTGINARPEFAAAFASCLARRTGLDFRPSGNFFEAMSSQDTAAELSGQLKVLSVSLMKISNDLRWMNSGPLAGLGEIALPALQPGSSIMPGKVNPVGAESVTMIAAQVIGNDATITLAGQSGNFQLNVMLPV